MGKLKFIIVAIFLGFLNFNIYIDAQDAQNSNLEKIAEGNILLYEMDSIIKENDTRYSSYGLVDVSGDYKSYYEGYKENTEIFERERYKRKIVIFEKETSACYQLVYSHWFIGQLFRFQEDHEKNLYPQSQLNVISRSIVWQGVKEAEAWVVHKYLLPETKSSNVGDKLRHLDVYIAFINMGENKTRIFYHITFDSEGKRSVEAAKKEVDQDLKAIIKYRKVK